MQTFERTGCLSPCKRNTYEMDIFKEVLVPGINGADTALHLFIPEPQFTVSEEFVVFDRLAFAADCAGMGGILLGVSLLAAYDYFLGAIGRMLCLQHRNKRGTTLSETNLQ